MAHHHPQLTAHSQLTNLEPGQIQCIQLPPTATFLTFPLPPTPTTAYHHQPTPFHLLRSATPLTHIQGLVTRTGGCIICLGGLPQEIPSQRISNLGPTEFFAKVCDLLQIPMNEILHEWTFDSSQKLPFCMSCFDFLQELIGINEQLEILRRRIKEGVEAIQAKIRFSNSRAFAVSDVRTFNFRNRALAPPSLLPSLTTSPGRMQAITREGDMIGGSNVDIGSIFDPMIASDSSRTISLQQYDSSTQTDLQSESSVFETIEFVPHSQDSTSNDCLTSGQVNTIIFDLQVDNELSQLQTTDSTENVVDTEDLNHGRHMENTLEYLKTNEKQNQIETAMSSSTITNPGKNSKVRKKSGKKSKTVLQNNKKSRKLAFSSSSGDCMKRKKSREEFAPVKKDDQGRLSFEDITILPDESDAGYICGKCGAKCGKRTDSMSLRKMKIHIKGVHLGAYNCNLCNKNFSSKDILDQHKFRAHQQQNVPCDICGRMVKPRYLNGHKYTHMNSKEKALYIAETGFKPSFYSEIKKFSCEVCDKRFSKRSVLVRHETTHLSTELRRTFECDKCDKVYKTEQALKEHRSLKHDRGIRRSLCKECGVFVHPKYLLTHLNSHLAKEKRPFVCKICQKRFVSQKSLDRHEKDHEDGDHSENYLYSCGVCGQRFLNEKSRNNHRKKSHDDHQHEAMKVLKKVALESDTSSRKKFPKKRKHSNEKVNCKCLECEEAFDDFDELEQHSCSKDAT